MSTRVGAIVIVAATMASGCVPDRPTRSALDRVLSTIECSGEVRAALHGWGARAVYIQGPPGGSGSMSYRIPTRRFAEWVVLTAPGAGPPTAVLMTPSGATGLMFGSDCTHTVREESRAALDPRDGAVFTDADLATVLAAADGRPVVVYVWAPHMPLSPDGWPHIEAATRSLGMDVVPLLMTHSDRDFARREAERVGMPSDGLREIDSNELNQRQAQVHAPSIVIFGPERVSPVLPGYRNADGYRRFLEAFIGAR